MPDLLQLTPPEHGVACLTLQRPEQKNALSIALRDEISDALSTLAANPDVKVSRAHGKWRYLVRGI